MPRAWCRTAGSACRPRRRRPSSQRTAARRRGAPVRRRPVHHTRPADPADRAGAGPQLRTQREDRLQPRAHELREGPEDELTPDKAEGTRQKAQVRNELTRACFSLKGWLASVVHGPAFLQKNGGPAIVRSTLLPSALCLLPWYSPPGAEADRHGHHAATRPRTSRRVWRRSPGPMRSSSSTAAAPTARRSSRARAGARVIVRDWPGYSAQKNFAAGRRRTTGSCRSMPTSACTPELADEIRARPGR